MAGNKTLPGLFRIERDSLITFLDLSSKLDSQQKIYPIAKVLLNDVALKEKFFTERKEEITSLEQVVSRQLLPFLAKNIQETMKEIGPELVELVTVADVAIRGELKKLLLRSLCVYGNFLYE